MQITYINGNVEKKMVFERLFINMKLEMNFKSIWKRLENVHYIKMGIIKENVLKGFFN